MATADPHAHSDITDEQPRHPDAALLRLGDALEAAVSSYWSVDALLSEGPPETVRDAPDAIESAWIPCHALARWIASRPAQTIDGLAVKARALAVLGEEGDCTDGSLVRDVIRVLGTRAVPA